MTDSDPDPDQDQAHDHGRFISGQFRTLLMFLKISLAASQNLAASKLQKIICEQLCGAAQPTGAGVTQFKIGLVGTYTS